MSRAVSLVSSHLEVVQTTTLRTVACVKSVPSHRRSLCLNAGQVILTER